MDWFIHEQAVLASDRDVEVMTPQLEPTMMFVGDNSNAEDSSAWAPVGTWIAELTRTVTVRKDGCVAIEAWIAAAADKLVVTGASGSKR
jgi:hypothetical protein